MSCTQTISFNKNACSRSYYYILLFVVIQAHVGSNMSTSADMLRGCRHRFSTYVAPSVSQYIE